MFRNHFNKCNHFDPFFINKTSMSLAVRTCPANCVLYHVMLHENDDFEFCMFAANGKYAIASLLNTLSVRPSVFFRAFFWPAQTDERFHGVKSCFLNGRLTRAPPISQSVMFQPARNSWNYEEGVATMWAITWSWTARNFSTGTLCCLLVLCWRVALHCELHEADACVQGCDCAMQLSSCKRWRLMV